MRLKYIKLAGFKSFVEPTKIAFPDAMTAIVGPNGCGKSNVIDAVRWVLGESSAKHLRGDAMTDVIFNGSVQRSAASLAGVELVFDNQDTRLEGQFAQYNEISVKRQVSRDGQSNYFLNGSKCRRRDITDLFMGTGLGPRSYAIIEQGTVSRLIESKPQDLRLFIEEAAEISRYKERRKETESRIRHTRDNLERLQDIRNELASQISKLNEQAQSAKRYRELKQQERSLNGEVIALRWREADQKMAQLTVKIDAVKRQLQNLDDQQSGGDAQMVQLQQQKSELTEVSQATRKQLYEANATVTRLEQQLLHGQQRQQQLNQERSANQTQIDELEQQQGELQGVQQALEIALQHSAPALDLLQQSAAASKQQYQATELQQEQLEQQREQAQRSQTQLQTDLHKAESQLASNRQNQSQFEQQQQRIRNQLELLDTKLLQQSVADAEVRIADSEQQLQRSERSQVEAKRHSEQLHLKLSKAQQQLRQCEQQFIEQQAKLAALQTLLAARQQQLPEALQQLPQLWQTLTVASPWDKAVETVLGDRLQAVISDSPQVLPSGVWQFSEVANELGQPRQWPTLASKVSSNYNLKPWLQHVYCADDEAQLQQWLGECQCHESIILPDGRWCGVGFQASAGEANQLPLTQLQSQIEQHQQQSEQLAKQQVVLENDVASFAKHYQQSQIQFEQIQIETQQSRDALTEQRHLRDKQQHQLDLMQQQRQQLQQQITELHQRQQESEQQAPQLQQSFIEIQQQLQQQQRQIEDQQQRLVQLRYDARNQRQQLEELAGKVQQSQLQQQSDSAKLTALAAQITHANQNSQQWRQRLKQCHEQLKKLDEPLQQQQEQLQQQLQQRSELETQQGKQQQQLTDIEQQLTMMLDSVRGQQSQHNKLQQQHNKLQLEHEGLRVKAQGQLDLLGEAQLALQPILAKLEATAMLSQRTKKLEQVKLQVEELGPINLAAIDEFEQQNQRKEYLDQQDADLNKALTMLEGAIAKIDRETKSRFKKTFDAINADLGRLFPKVFGGGSASLALTGDDLLEAGVTIMAQPPGKKNSTIHLLSGGEKALTALSLVFAIFRLNPAPFCLLDEVDAPLDDANVGRFCRLVKEMSETVQFIFISHNKVSMEMADRLTGVTMAEPGCSRIVAVDIKEAEAMAEVG